MWDGSSSRRLPGSSGTEQSTEANRGGTALRSFVVEHLIDYRLADVTDEGRRITGDRGVGVILDPPGGESSQRKPASPRYRPCKYVTFTSDLPRANGCGMAPAPILETENRPLRGHSVRRAVAEAEAAIAMCAAVWPKYGASLRAAFGMRHRIPQQSPSLARKSPRGLARPLHTGEAACGEVLRKSSALIGESVRS